MNTREILLMFLLLVILFVPGFMMTELIVSHFEFIGAFKRFILRLVFLIQYSLIIYLLFEHIGNAKKSNQCEKNASESGEISSDEKSEKK